MDDPFDPTPPSGGLNIGRLILNVLTVIVLLTTVYVGFRFVSIFLNPQSSTNPFPLRLHSQLLWVRRRRPIRRRSGCQQRFRQHLRLDRFQP